MELGSPAVQSRALALSCPGFALLSALSLQTRWQRMFSGCLLGSELLLLLLSSLGKMRTGSCQGPGHPRHRWATSTQSQGHLSSLWGCHCPRPLRALSPPVPQPALGPAPAAAPCCGLIPAGLFSRARCAWLCRSLKPSGLALGTRRPAVLEATGSSAPHSRSLPSSPAGLGREGTLGSGCRSWH